jgi:hypothetical protein
MHGEWKVIKLAFRAYHASLKRREGRSTSSVLATTTGKLRFLKTSYYTSFSEFLSIIPQVNEKTKNSRAKLFFCIDKSPCRMSIDIPFTKLGIFYYINKKEFKWLVWWIIQH